MTADLSHRGRAANLARMASETFNVAVVGGGIVGAAIARDAALRGLKTALIDKGDFASGTSGKTSRLVHGGLRYLKNGKIRLVRTALRERDLLLRRAPGLVWPLAFTLPAYRGRGAGPLSLRLGLLLYDALSRDKVLPRRAWLDAASTLAREPQLSPDALRASGRYHDALTDDARLVLAVVRAAADAGAVAANYAEAIDLAKEGGSVVGVHVRPRLVAAEPFLLRAPVVVNAIGVWLTAPYAAGVPARPLRPTKGIHIFVPRDRVGNREAVVLTSPRDGRMLFVLPWGRLALVGTTDTDHRGDLNAPVPEAADVDYLLDAVNATFPFARLARADVVSAYAGLRPLLGSTATRESDISREHEIFESPDGLLSIAGGKLTTMRAMAEEVVDRVCVRLGRSGPRATREAGLGPSPEARERFRALGLDDATAEHLGCRHDPETLARFLSEPRARERVDPELPFVWAEVDAAVEAEMAQTLADVMVRRLGLFYESMDQGRTVAPLVAARIAPHLGWTADRVTEEIRAYGALIDDHRRFREDHGR